MGRKYIDFREFQGSKCSLRFSGEEQEMIQAVRQHAMNVHRDNFKESEFTDDKIRGMLKDEPMQGEGRRPAA